MSRFFAESQNEAERLRATKTAVNAILEQFRSRPQSEWKTILAEVSLALEGEWTDEVQTNRPGNPKEAPHVASAVANAAPERTVMLLRSEDSVARNSNADRVIALLRNTPGGITLNELAAALYGADDERGTDKTRSVVHFLQKKKGLAIIRAANGKFVLLRPAVPSGGATSSTQPTVSLSLPAGGGSK